MRRLTSLMLLLLSLGLSSPVPAQDLSLGEIINKAGRQRMLTQRIVKDYAQIGQFVQEQQAQKELRASLHEFEGNLKQLQAASSSPEISLALEQVEQLWGPFKAIAQQEARREQAPPLRQAGERLLKAAHQVTLLLEQQAATPAGHLINLSGRQRMLSQRIANLYLMQSWGYSEYAEEYRQATREFQSALNELQTAAQNTQAIEALLIDVQRQWAMFSRSATLEKNGEFIPLLITLSAQKLLRDMEQITALYAAMQH